MINAPRQELLSVIDNIIADEQLICDRNNSVWSFTENTAKSIVKRIFGDHKRDSREPTLTHIFTVSGMDEKGNIVYNIDSQDRIIRLFHDLFEDTALEISDGERWGVKTSTLAKIGLLTREDGIKYLDYIVRLSHDPQCVDIKLDDIKDNLDHSENVNLIPVEKLEKINRKIISNNYLKAVKSGVIPAGYNILTFITENCTGNNIETAKDIINKHSTYHLLKSDTNSTIEPKPPS